MRNTTDGEKDPYVMGFTLLEDNPPDFPVGPDVEVEDAEAEVPDEIALEVEGREGQLVVMPNPLVAEMPSEEEQA